MSNEHPSYGGISDTDLQTLRTFYKAFEGTPDLLDESVVPDWQDIPLAPGQAAGRDGFKPMIAAFSKAFADIRIEIVDVIGGTDKAAVRAVITGRHVGDWFGVAASGRTFSLPIHEFHAFENGRITRTWHMEDWMGWFAQMGAWPVTN
ncbi:ester cyclase [Phyllobacterium sp. 0TCS1.6C]|uniref:ester cyclase n=1 Tax=unclassified Phyllobacterium TaxID=2638441 RepID=UPI0022644483|nr:MULTISPECIES: ester cyclase [unclassified Phyllobacterium]MCX8281078.1 ester cyclase [Phyllobacterium sp. 0TCS1.6C]MCX8294635.1 ester cyclase [Phyllobacterium sp. 0TCS1.6A]